MKALVQRVLSGSVTVDGATRACIGPGMVVLLGIRRGDREDDAIHLASRCATLRIFNDPAGKMNLSIRDTEGAALVVSQFTLYADTRRGNRPGFTDAAPPAEAEPLYRSFVTHLAAALGEERVCTGIFQASMQVNILNDGPVTVMLESRDAQKEDQP